LSSLYWLFPILTVSISFDYVSQYKSALAEIAGWLADGSLQRKFHVIDGLENAPSALPMLFNGGNTGKLFVPITFLSDPILTLIYRSEW
jgi:NADPH-dependent curcumin reductase CurA